MTRLKSLFAAVVLAAIVAVVPANAQNFHFVGSGSSAQFLQSAIAAYTLANSLVTSTACRYHFTGSAPKSNVTDLRAAGIPVEPANVWIVWIAACSDTTGNTSISDVWMDASVDSTVGVRTFLATDHAGVRGAHVTVTAAATADNRVKSYQWGDNTSDVSPIPANLSTAINANSGIRVNAGLTDIRPEDALFATTRAMAKLDTAKWKGLGYISGVKNIGASIDSEVNVGVTFATPIAFGLGGAKDPISGKFVPATVTVPIGAAPIVFIANNSTGTPFATGLQNLGATPTFDTAHLFDGTTICDTTNAAFTGSDGRPAQKLVVLLREPLSGTMNTAEFTEFRTSGNPNDSQEKGVNFPLNATYNPLNLNCVGGGGKRIRAIGTGEVITGLQNNNSSLGYIFGGYSNPSKIALGTTGSTKFNYLTLDGFDPMGITTTGQQLPACAANSATNTCGATSGTFGTQTVSSQWSGQSYPDLRAGNYTAWSLYRWVGSPSDAHFCASNSGDATAACNSTSSYTVTSATIDDDLVCLNVSGTLGSSTVVGANVTVAGFAPSSMNGTFPITVVDNDGASGNNFCYALPGNDDVTVTTLGTASTALPTDAFGFEALAQSTQDLVDVTVADFVPFNTSSTAPFADGLNIYRSHYTQALVAGNNGPLVTTANGVTRGGDTEAGGDEGGCIVVGDVPSNQLNCHQ